MNANAGQLLNEKSFLTAAGTETYLFFEQRFPMRDLCAFEIFEHESALAQLEARYLYPLISAVNAHGHGLLLDALVWRAHPDYIDALGYPASDIKRLNHLAISRTRDAVEVWRERNGRSFEEFPILIAADIGPRGDGYRVDSSPSAQAAFDYHRVQLANLADTNTDVVCAWTMTNLNEAIGITRAAAELELPIIVSPTVETDGRLPDGTTLGDFICRVDDATQALPLYYAVNCAHPTHLLPTLESARQHGEAWLERLGGFRANSSKKSHEELDNSTELDRGEPKKLATALASMKSTYDLKLLGGCCGTDVEHIREIALAATNGGSEC